MLFALPRTVPVLAAVPERLTAVVEQPEKGTTCTTCGVAQVRVPVLSNTMVSACASASRYLPPFSLIWRIILVMLTCRN